MYNLKDFEKYIGQDVAGKSVLCWDKKLGYFFLSSYNAEHKIIAVYGGDK